MMWLSNPASDRADMHVTEESRPDQVVTITSDGIPLEHGARLCILSSAVSFSHRRSSGRGANLTPCRRAARFYLPSVAEW